MAVRLGDGEAQMGQAFKVLQEHWMVTAADWQDKAREDFEKEYLEELQQAVAAAQRASKAVNDLLRQAIRDCS